MITLTVISETDNEITVVNERRVRSVYYKKAPSTGLKVVQETGKEVIFESERGVRFAYYKNDNSELLNEYRQEVVKLDDYTKRCRDVLQRSLLNITGDDWREAASKLLKEI